MGHPIMKPIAHGTCAVAALFAFQFTGEAVVRMAGLPLPGPLAGMLLLFLALAWRGKVPASFEKTSSQLLQHFMLLLLPSIVGISLQFGRLAKEWMPFLVACVAGAAVTVVVTAVTLQWMLKFQRAHGR